MSKKVEYFAKSRVSYNKKHETEQGVKNAQKISFNPTKYIPRAPKELTETLLSTREQLENAGLRNFNLNPKSQEYYDRKLSSIAINPTTIDLLKKYGDNFICKFVKQCEDFSSPIFQQAFYSWDTINLSNKTPDLSAITNKESQYSDKDIDEITKTISSTEKEAMFEDLYGSELNYKIATILSLLGIEIKTQEPEYPEETEIKETSDKEKRAKIENFFKNYSTEIQEELNKPYRYGYTGSPKTQIIQNLYEGDNKQLQTLLDNKHDDYFFVLIDLIVQRYLYYFNKNYFQEGKTITEAIFDKGASIPEAIIQAIKEDKIPLNYFYAFLQCISNYNYSQSIFWKGLDWNGTTSQIINFKFTPKTIQNIISVKNGLESLPNNISKTYEPQRQAINAFKNLFTSKE